MREESVKFLQELVDAPSPSGFEQPAQRVVREYVASYADEVKTDVHGNVIASKNPDGKVRILLAGHCDEIGFVLSYINDEGYLYFKSIGGVDAGIVSGQRMYIHTENGPVLGITGKKAIHIMEGDEKNKVPKLDSIWIDIGTENKEKAESVVQIGNPITFATSFEVLHDDIVVSRAFDDKMGTFVVCETLRLLDEMEFSAAVFAVSTVQEEVGLRGARTSTFGVNPHIGIAVDVTHSSDYPDSDKKRTGDIKLGKGPVLYVGANINPVLGKLLIDTAKAKEIPYQFNVATGGTGTDANAIQLTRAGVATGLVSVPNRYMHTPLEVISLVDLENAAKLLAETICQITPDTDFTPM